MMKCSAFNRKNAPGNSARVVDGKLILSFPEARTPVVWQMDLEQMKASSLEVNEGGDGVYTLCHKTQGGGKADKEEIIAPFDSREQAVSALMAVSCALENAHGYIRPQMAGSMAVPAGGNGQQAAAVYHFSSSRPAGRGGKWVGGILAVLMVLILIMLWSAMMQKPPGRGSGATVSGGADPKSTTGVPLSADEYLKGF